MTTIDHNTNSEDKRDSFAYQYLHHAGDVLHKSALRLGETINRCTDILIEKLRDNKKILICGNGGSASDAQHFASELVVHFDVFRKALPAIALTSDSAILTSAGNDFSFEEIFSRQVEALGQEGDVLIAISTSGTSKNILKAVQSARGQGLFVIAMTGALPNPLSELSHFPIGIPGDNTADIQTVDVAIIHAICAKIDQAFSDPDNCNSKNSSFNIVLF